MAKALDSASSVTAVVDQLAADGYGAVARYLFVPGSSQFKQLLTKQEAAAISAAGMWVVTVWESGFPTTADYFTDRRGTADSNEAFYLADTIGQPAGTPIYFAVDADLQGSDVAAYFASINAESQKNSGAYHIGVYGSGDVIEYLKSRNWQRIFGLHNLKVGRDIKGELGQNPNLLQFGETTVLGRDVDIDQTDGAAGGWKIA